MSKTDSGVELTESHVPGALPWLWVDASLAELPLPAFGVRPRAVPWLQLGW